MRPVDRSDRGLTLIEIIVGVVLTGVVTAGIFQAMFSGLKTLDNTNAKIAGSNDTQLIASYFTGDVASAESVSTTGSSLHFAPSVHAPQANAQLVNLWALRRPTAVSPPEGASERWDTAGSNFAIAMADEQVSAIGQTGDRLATSDVGTSSISHTIVLKRASSTPIAFVNKVSVAPSPSDGIALSQPTGSTASHVFVAHIVVEGGSAATVTAPNLQWKLVDERSAGNELRSAIYVHNGIPSEWRFTFNGVVREAVGAVAAYSGVATGATTAVTVGAFRNDVSPCGGDTPALLLRWTDRGTNEQTVVSYVSKTVGGERQLLRQRCTGTSGAPQSEQTLARELAARQVVATCSKALCGPLPVSVTLSMAEKPTGSVSVGRSYQVRAATRTSE